MESAGSKTETGARVPRLVRGHAAVTTSTAAPHEIAMVQARTLTLVRQQLLLHGPSLPCARIAVLVMPGSFNPVHADHVACMHAARECIEQAGMVVVGGFLQPSSDKYLVNKCGQGGAMALHDRISACSLAVQDGAMSAPARGSVSSGGSKAPNGVQHGSQGDAGNQAADATDSDESSTHQGEGSVACADWLGVWRSGKAHGSRASRDCGAFFATKIADALSLLETGWEPEVALRAVAVCAGTGTRQDLHRACSRSTGTRRRSSGCSADGNTVVSGNGRGHVGSSTGLQAPTVPSAALDHGIATLARGVVVEAVQVCGADFVQVCGGGARVRSAQCLLLRLC